MGGFKEKKATAQVKMGKQGVKGFRCGGLMQGKDVTDEAWEETFDGWRTEG